MVNLDKMRNVIIYFLILFFISGSKVVFGIEGTQSKAAILMDQQTKRILYEQKSDEQLPIASTTKVITAILAIEMGSLYEETIISEKSASTEEASIDLVAGEKIILQNLLLGTLIKSGNDAAVAVAELIGGTEKQFIDIMNKKAKILGAYNSHFVNPNGLPADHHFSSAHDLAIISSYAMKNPIFRDMVQIKTAHIPNTHSGVNRYIKNTNKLLWDYPFATGIKTGTTDAAGPCLIASAEKGNTKLIVVVLNSEHRFEDSKRLLEWGFEHYNTVIKFKKGEVFCEKQIKKGMPENLTVYVDNDLIYTHSNEEKVYEKVEWYDYELPILKNQKLGKITVTVGDHKYEANLIAGNQVRKKNFKERIGF